VRNEHESAPFKTPGPKRRAALNEFKAIIKYL
jgi:hypothetical protein